MDAGDGRTPVKGNIMQNPASPVKTPRREAQIVASMYVPPKLSPSRDWRERSQNAKLGCMKRSLKDRGSPPFVYDKPSFVAKGGHPTKVEEEAAVKRYDEAVGHVKRSTFARQPVPPSSPTRQGNQLRHGHRKLYYSPYKGLSYGVATPSVMKFVSGLGNGVPNKQIPALPNFESGNTTFIRPISRPMKSKGHGIKSTARVRVEPQHLKEDPRWNVKAFCPGAVERRWVNSDQVRNALTWPQ